MKLVLVVLLALLPLATPAPAGTASKKLKAAATAAIKDYKATSKDVFELIDLQLQLLEKDVAVFGWTAGAQDDLFEAFDDFQDGMWLATLAAQGALGLAAQEALADFAGGGALDGDFPAGFQPGDGGPFDDFRAARSKADAKQYAKVAQRLSKTAKVLEQEGDILLTFVLLPIEPALALQADEAASAVIAPDMGLDTLVGVGTAAAPGGTLFAAGLGYLDPLTVNFEGPGGAPSTDVIVDDGADDRWSLVHDAVSDGHWLVGVREESEAELLRRVIGLR